MRVFRPAPLCLASLLISATILAQQLPVRDPQAIAVLQQSFAAMGGVIPADSVATGHVVLVAGSKTENGTTRILTQGLDQSAISIQTADGFKALVYSRGSASELQGSSVKSLQMELVVICQSPYFPIPLLTAAITNGDTAFRYIGQETLDGLQTHHISFWNTFHSNPKGRHLANFSVRDLWVDAATGLPRKLSYIRRAASGSEAGLLIEVLYADYRSIGGLLYPFHLEESLNGTPWATITIDHVTFNNGLTDADFPVQ